jgi:hypothetical protein
VELLVILSLFIGLAILAVRYGYDSRDRLRSAEELLGAQGLAWVSQADPNAATRRRARPGGTPARHHHRPTARVLSTFL